MNGDMQSLYNSTRSSFIEARTRMEYSVSKLASDISQVNVEEVFGSTYIPPNMSLKAMCPELYKDVPDPEVAREEQLKAKEIFDKINEAISAYYGDAIECYQEYLQLNNAGTH